MLYKHTLISIASIGDCCVDIYPNQKRLFLGGTAFNVAVQAQKAGAKASLVSAVGNDAYGDMYDKECKLLGINTDYLTIFPGQTSTLQVPLDKEGKPVFSGWELGVLPEFVLNDSHKEFLAKHTVVRGILLKPLRELFKSFSDLKLPNTLKVADFAGGSQYSVEKEEILNYMHSIDVFVRSVDIADMEELSFLKDTAHKYNKIVIVLLGKEGSVVYTKETEYRQPAIKTEVIDTTGAGDAYIAHFLVSYFSDQDIRKAMEKATIAAANVIMHFGATL